MAIEKCKRQQTTSVERIYKHYNCLNMCQVEILEFNNNFYYYRIHKIRSGYLGDTSINSFNEKRQLDYGL